MVFWVKLTLFRIDLSGTVDECRDQMALLPTLCYAHPTIMKGTVVPYLKKIRKYKNHVTQSLSSPDIIFFTRN